MAEPWYHVCVLVGIPPAKLWFHWQLEGLEHIPAEGPALIAANHASYLDPFANAMAVIEAGRRPRFLAKQELFSIPLVGRALRGAGQIPVRRGSHDRAPLVRAEEALAAGEVVVVYPEGTVTNREDHLPMRGKTGAVRLALASGLPITPMASWGSHPVWQKTGPGSLRFGRPVWVAVGEPIDLASRGRGDDPETVQALTAEVMEALTALVLDLRSRYPKRWLDDGQGDERG